MKLGHQLVTAFAAAWLSQACAVGDIVLGERGGSFVPPASGSIEPAPDAGADSGGSITLTGQAGVAAMSGSTAAGSGGAGAPAQAGAPAPAGAGAEMDAGPPNLVARPSPGCGKTARPTDTSIQVGPARVDFRLDLPTPYNPTRAYPLVMAFRNSDLTVDEFSAELNLGSVAGHAAIIVYANPVSESVAWEYPRDMPTVDALLSKLGEDYCIDLDRVFALGAGAGALFVNIVGCLRATQVRAIAPLSSAPPPPGPCIGRTAVWLLQQADAEPRLVGAGLGNRDFWAGRNSCNIRISTPVAPATCLEYSGCVSGMPVRYCEHDGSTLPSFAASGAWSFFESL